MDVDPGALLQKAFDIRWQVVEANAVDGGQADISGHNSLEFLHLALEGRVSLENLFAVFIQHLSLRGEAEMFLAALDEQRSEVPLEGADGLADSRLRDVVDLRGFGEAF